MNRRGSALRTIPASKFRPGDAQVFYLTIGGELELGMAHWGALNAPLPLDVRFFMIYRERASSVRVLRNVR